MKLEHLEYLLAVVDNGSINKAAKELFCTQPALTNVIKSIEQELGYPILERSHNGVAPNDLGKFIVSDARFIINRVNEWKRYADSKFFSGNIDVLCSGAVNQDFIVKCVFNLRQNHPDINIRLIESIYRDVEFLNELFQENYRFGSFNAAPLELEEVQKSIEKNGLQLMQVHESQYAAYINSEDPLAKKDSLYLEDIRGRNIVLFRNPSKFPYIEFLKSVNCNCTMQIGDSASVILAAAMGEAIAIRPTSAVANNYLVHSGAITIKCFSDCPMPICMYFIYPQNSRLNKYEKIFVNTIKEIAN